MRSFVSLECQVRRMISLAKHPVLHSSTIVTQGALPSRTARSPEALLLAFFQEMNNARQLRIERGLTVAGFTLWGIIVCSWLVLPNSHYHTLRRAAALDISNLTAWLEMAWILAAATFAVIQRRNTSMRFRIVLLLNGLVVSLLIAELYSATLG